MSVRTETYTMSATATEGTVRGDDSIQALSSDGLLMPLDITIAFRLVGGDAPRVYRDIGADYVDKIIRPASRTAVREAIAGFTAQEAYSTKREALPQKMHDLLTERMRSLLEQREDFKGATGFIVDQVMLRKIQLPDKVKNAIEAKLEAAQQAEQMQFVLDKERQEAERKRIEAKGVSDFQTIVSQSINANLLQWKGIEATETWPKSQNAKIVVIGSGQERAARDPQHGQGAVNQPMALFGLGQQKPHHYREMVRIAWENRDQLPFAWRILTRGVCDGCALGTSGLSDWTLAGTHLCMVRLELMRLNTAPALDPGVARRRRAAGRADRPRSCARSAGCPSRCCGGAASAGFRVVAGTRRSIASPRELRAADPGAHRRSTSPRAASPTRSTTRRRRRRASSAPTTSTTPRGSATRRRPSAMKATLGYGASTCSYADWLDADLIVLFGSNVANNQPVTTKYLHHAKEHGAQIAVVNPYREPGLERYWIPSIAVERARSARRSPTTGSTCTPAATSRSSSACCARSSRRGGVDEAFVARAHRRASTEARRRALAARLGDARARERRDARAACEAFARLLDRPAERGLRLVDGPDAARARRGHDQGAGERRPRARTAGPAESRPGADPRPLRRAGRRRSRLRAGRRRGDRARAGREVWGFPVPDGAAAGRRPR